MNTIAALPSPDSDPQKLSGHCQPGEYEEFLANSVWREDRRSRLLGKQRRFATAYPDLDAWMQLPLQIRLGWRNNETQTRRTRDRTSSDVTADWINFNARHYLLYLSLTGRLRLDWGWLLGIGVLKPWTVAESLRLPLFEQADALAAKHRELGLSTKSCRHGVHWGLARLVLHRADADLSTLTTGDVEELRDAIRSAATIPGIPEVLGDRLDSTRLQWSSRAFATGVALYHAGVIDELPKREVARPRVSLSTVPRIAAVMNRYVAERLLIDSKSSVDQTRAALHRLSAWLAETRPAVESLAELTRPDLVDFLTWMTNQRKLKHPDQELSVSYRKMVVWQINAFFRYGFNAEWDDMPAALRCRRLTCLAACIRCRATSLSRSSNR